jgi:hypothetical protein
MLNAVRNKGAGGFLLVGSGARHTGGRGSKAIPVETGSDFTISMSRRIVKVPSLASTTTPDDSGSEFAKTNGREG